LARYDEQQQRAPADAAELPQVPDRGDPGDQAEEDQRDHQHPDEGDEYVADDLDAFRPRPPEPADEHAENERSDHTLPARYGEPGRRVSAPSWSASAAMAMRRYVRASASRSWPATASSRLCRVALTRPNSITGTISRRNRASEVPPVVEGS